MKNIDTKSLARTVFLAISMLNLYLTKTGNNPLPIDENTVYEVLTWIAALYASFLGLYKNNDFTPEAQITTKQMKVLKRQKRQSNNGSPFAIEENEFTEGNL